MPVVIVLEMVLALVLMAALILPVLDVLVAMESVPEVLVVTGGSTGSTPNSMITTATVAPTATNPNETRIPIITDFLLDNAGRPAMTSFIPPRPRPPESSPSSRAGSGPTSQTGIPTASSTRSAPMDGRQRSWSPQRTSRRFRTEGGGTGGGGTYPER